MPKAERKSARDLRKLSILPILPRALERILSFYEITPGRCLIFPLKTAATLMEKQLDQEKSIKIDHEPCQFTMKFVSNNIFNLPRRNITEAELKSITDIQRENSPSNKTQTFTKDINIDIWVFVTLNQLFTRAKFSR